MVDKDPVVKTEASEFHLAGNEVLRILRKQVKRSDLHLGRPLATVWRIDWGCGRQVRSLSYESNSKIILTK